MATKIFTPQRIYGLNKLSIADAKVILNDYIDSIDFLPLDLKTKIKNIYKAPSKSIHSIHKAFDELKKFFNSDTIKNLGVGYSNGDMFEIAAPLIKYEDTDTIQYLKSGEIGNDCIINNVNNTQIKYMKGVNTGLVGYVNQYKSLLKELKTPYYDKIFNTLQILTTSRKTNILKKIFTVVNNIGQPLYINGIEITEEHQKFIIEHCPLQDDKNNKGKRFKKIEEIREFMINTYGKNVFDYYEESYEINYPKWEDYKNGKGKKPQKRFLDYKKYDAFTLHIIYNLFEKMLNECYIKEINDFVHYVAKNCHFQLLKCDNEQLYLIDIETIQVKVDSSRYFGELNYHGAGTISIEFLGV